MRYISTRGQAPALNFEDVLLTGLASDGGLYVPETLPTYSAQEIASWAGLNYAQLALKIIEPFVAGGFVGKAVARRVAGSPCTPHCVHPIHDGKFLQDIL